MSFENITPTTHVQGLWAESSTKKLPYGTRFALGDGRVFRYAKMGATAGVAGNIYQGVAESANHINETVATATAIGGDKVYLTLGATAVTENEYAEGYFSINDATGEGHYYKVRSHPAADASAALTVTLYDTIRVATVAGTSEWSMHHSEYRNVIIHPSPPTALVVGVATTAVTANYYCWLQTWGPCAVLSDGTPAVNVRVIPSGSVNGAVATGVETDVVPQVGIMLGGAGVDTEYGMVNLTIAP